MPTKTVRRKVINTVVAAVEKPKKFKWLSGWNWKKDEDGFYFDFPEGTEIKMIRGQKEISVLVSTPK